MSELKNLICIVCGHPAYTHVSGQCELVEEYRCNCRKSNYEVIEDCIKEAVKEMRRDIDLHS